jgi:Flp pilus assembly protein TadD
VRRLAVSALWSVWFRADTPENNEALAQVADQINRHQLDEAVARATHLIERAPGFAEAYNQRAIAEFFLGRFRESADDCRLTLERNPFHIGALSGLAKCLIQLGRREDALKVLRRASRLQPFEYDLRNLISALEAAND